MPTIDEKVSKFMEAIDRYNNTQRSKIKSEMDEYITTQLEQAETQVLHDAYRLIQKENEQMSFEIRRELSRKEMEAKKELLSYRMKLVDSVFEMAKEKLVEYTKTNEYVAYIENNAKKIATKLQSDDVVLSVTAKDLALKDKIVKAFGSNCEVVVSEDITIGGILGFSEKLGLLIDETLDTGLDLKHEWFYSNSKFTV